MENKAKQTRIANERIEILFSEADEIFKKNPKLANRYVELARKIAMKIKLRMPRKFKRKYCKHCYSYLKHGVNCQTRINKKIVLTYCFNCKKYTRIPFWKKKQC
ncbi:ribonuclease P [Candidatus Woesearchaeota archaeon]|nr:ribonuclease P [Candidatus Woesearchaeota archaeon]